MKFEGVRDNSIIPQLSRILLAAGILANTAGETTAADERLRRFTQVPASCTLAQGKEKCSMDLSRQLESLASFARGKEWQKDLAPFDKTKPNKEKCDLTLTWLRRNVARIIIVADFLETHYPNRKRSENIRIHPEGLKKAMPHITDIEASPDLRKKETCTMLVRGAYWLIQSRLEKLVIDEIQDVIAMLKGKLGRSRGDAEKASTAYLEMLESALPRR